MKSFKKILLKYISPTKLMIVFILLTNWLIMKSPHPWRKDNAVFVHDVQQYYSYLPATFIYKDLTLKFIDKKDFPLKDKFWAKQSDSTHRVIKMSNGMAIMYLPFFLGAHTYATFTNYQADGFSLPYKFSMLICSLFYQFLGLFFLRKILLKYFTEIVSVITMFAIFYATNLVYYSTYEPNMSHLYNFTLFVIFIWYSIIWHENQKLKTAIVLGLIFGLITLIRPTNFIISVIFIFWNVKSFKDLKSKATLFLKNYKSILLISLFTLIVWIPQLLYWKIVTGNYIYYSYSNEGFFLTNPQIINSLFSYRKGWIVYTPIVLLFFIGLYAMYKNFRTGFFPVIIFLILNIYVVSSWWCWWYGGSFGLRAYIDSYAVLSLPFAFLVKECMSSKKNKILFLSLIGLFFIHNGYQVHSYRYQSIHFDSNSKKSYWSIYSKLNRTQAQKALFEAPNYEKALLGIQDIEQIFLDFEKNDFKYNFPPSNSILETTEAFSGNKVLTLEPDSIFKIEATIEQLTKYGIIQGIVAEFFTNFKTTDIKIEGKVCLSEKKGTIFEKTINFSTQKTEWNKLSAVIFFEKELKTNRKSIFSFYIKNVSQQQIRIDDFRIKYLFF